MGSEAANHLWQSTIFALAVGLLALAFRKNRAQVRHWLWFSASCKFLVPLGLLASLGSEFHWPPAGEGPVRPAAVGFAFAPAGEPLSGTVVQAPAMRNHDDWAALAILCLWACGVLVVAVVRVRAWQRIRAAVRASRAIPLAAAIQIRSSPGLLEPGVVGLVHPVLLLPNGIMERLSASQWSAILAHELCHVRRRDNLTAAIHMLVEAIFWFHPLIWWIGARLVEERERACDEAVLRQGGDAQRYAEAIVSVCKNYVESSLPCVSGVTGSPLKKRIEAILAGCVVSNMTIARKFVLGAVAIATVAFPIFVGLTHPPLARAQTATLTGAARFESLSVKPCPAFRRNTPSTWSAGTFHSQCTTAERLIEQAFGLFGSGHLDNASALLVTGGPAWITSDLYEVDAQPASPQGHSMMNGPMLQALLADKFALQVHRETREIAIYRLTTAAGGPKLEPFQGTCKERDFDQPPSDEDCGTARGSGSDLHLKAESMADLCAGLSVLLDQQVVDKTGLAGRYNLHLNFSAANAALLNRPRALRALSDPTSPAPPPLIFPPVKTALGELGLNIEPGEGPGEVLVVDRVEKPSGN